jgi:hypothetical protein
MCAYNVRKNKRVDYDPATGEARAQHQTQEMWVVLFGVAMMALLVWVARQVLFTR